MSTYVAPTAQFYPSASMRVTDIAQYHAIQAAYNLSLGTSDPAGSNIIIGRSPVALATEFGISWVNNPTTSDYGNLPCVFTVAGSSVVNGTTITPDATQNGVQTLTSAYTDPNGQAFTSVTWAWQVELVYYSVLAEDVFSQQVVTWTGDGASSRSIPTTADLTIGQTAIWIFSGGGGAPVFATGRMVAAGKFASYAVTPASPSFGVTSLTSTGFVVTPGSGVDVNTAARQYTAIVWNDTNGTKMQTGTYTGDYTGIAPHNVGAGILTGALGVADSIPISLLITTPGVQPFGGNPDGVVAFPDPDGSGTVIALNVTLAQSAPLTGEITSLGVAAFSTGATAYSNGTGRVFYYAAFAIGDTDPIRTTFLQTWKVLGTGGTDTANVSFRPEFALGITYEYPSRAAGWRGPLDAGTTSHLTTSGSGVASGGLEAFGASTITLGSSLSPVGVTTYGFACASGSSASFPQTTWIHTTPIDNGDGTISLIEETFVGETPPDDTWDNGGLNPTSQWWCNATFGWSVYQIDSPGAGWVACVGPASSNGWYLSTDAFGGPDTIVSNGQPADPRTWANLSTWCTTGNMSVYGGSPAASCNTNNKFVYPAAGYTVGTHYPPIRIFDGRADRELCRLPPTAAGGIPKAVISMLAANGAVYFSTWESGTTSANWLGRVFQLDPETGVVTPLGATFTAGEMPYALCWHMGRLWCGTNNSIGTVGKVYFFRPGIDTAWTQDYATSSSTAGGVTSMASYKGLLYVGTDNAAASRGKVLVRDTAGAYTTSQTGSGGTARVNNGYVALTVLGSNLYASYWNNDTTVISKIEKYTGSAWSTAYTGTGTTLCPYILLQLDNSEIYAVGGSLPYDAVLLVTADGTTWTDLTAELPDETATLLPMFGAVAV